MQKFMQTCSLLLVTTHAFKTSSSDVAAASERLLAAVARLKEVSTLDNMALAADGRMIMAEGTKAIAAAVHDPYQESTHVLLTLPRSAALTAKALHSGKLAHFLESPSFRKHLAQQKPRISAPSAFIFALWFLYQKHAGDAPHAEPVWQAWVDYHLAAHTGEHALYFWTAEELEVLEEKRLIESATEFRKTLDKHYDQLMRPLLETFPHFFPPASISRREFLQALSVATSVQVNVDGFEANTSAIVPLPLRQHPSGTVSFQEVEQERVSPTGDMRSVTLLHLVSESARPLKQGEELTLRMPRRNDALLLEAGYMWNDVKVQSHPMRLSLPRREAEDAARLRLLKSAKLNATQDFALMHGGLPPKLFLWSRISLCSEEELSTAGE